ncbi:two-component system response regulator [Patescibacteria group bacterium]
MKLKKKSSRTKATVLLIEDEPLINKVYQAAFKNTDYSLLVATNKEEALDLLFKHQPPLILLDLIIPVSNDLVIEYEHPVGFDILELVKQSDITHDAHVFVLTNLDNDIYVKRAKSLGVDKYLIKTDTSPSQLIDQVIKFLG